MPTYAELVEALIRVQHALADERDGETSHPDGLILEEVKYLVVDPILDELGVGCGLPLEQNRAAIARAMGVVCPES